MIDTLYDKFKPWSAKGSVYIISDTHFEDEDYAGDGMYCAKNHLVYDFSLAKDNCENESN